MTWIDVPGVLELPDGRRVRGTRARAPRGDAPAPDFGVLLLGRTPPPQPWPTRWVAWPDFGLPRSTGDAVEALVDAWNRCAEQRVEVACAGGIGRTGSALALFAALSGVDPQDAVAYVRARYHPRAVETRRQERWVRSTAVALG